MMLPYSAISKHSLMKGSPTAIRDWLMLSQEDSHVNHSQCQGSVKKNWIVAICGLKLLRLLGKYDQNLHFWKMFQGSSLPFISEESLQIFPQLGMIVDGALWEGIMLEHRMRGNDCGFLPTVMSSEAIQFANGNIRTTETWQSTTRLSHYLIGMELNLKNHQKCPEKHIHVHPCFAEWMMDWPINWTELKPLAMGKFHQWLNWHGKSLQED